MALQRAARINVLGRESSNVLGRARRPAQRRRPTSCQAGRAGRAWSRPVLHRRLYQPRDARPRRRGEGVRLFLAAMPNRPSPLVATVWVRRECATWDRGPYHWTRECVEGRALIDLDRSVADRCRTFDPCRSARARPPHARRGSYLPGGTTGRSGVGFTTASPTESPTCVRRSARPRQATYPRSARPSSRACHAVCVLREALFTAAPHTGQISKVLTLGSTTIIGVYSSSGIGVVITCELTVYRATSRVVFGVTGQAIDLHSTASTLEVWMTSACGT